MRWQYTPYSIPLFLVPAIALALLPYIWRHRTAPGARALMVAVTAAAVWSLGYALELLGADLRTKLFWVKTQYLGDLAVTPAWFVFALCYTGRSDWFTPRNRILLAIAPVATLIVVWSNDLHGLMWNRLSLDTSGAHPGLVLSYGPWYWAWVAVAYLLFLLATARLLLSLRERPRLFGRQVGVLLLGSSLPWLANGLYQSGLGPLANLDLTPMAFAASGILFALGLLQYHLLDITPVARRAILHAMREGALVLDDQSRVVEMNPAAERLCGFSAAQAIGAPAAQIFPEHAELFAARADGVGTSTTTVLWAPQPGASLQPVPESDEPAPYFHELRVSPLADAQGRGVGRLVLIQDVTDRARAEAALRAAHDALELRVQERTQELAEANQKLRLQMAERVDAEEALRQSEEKYRLLAENVTDVIWATDLDLRFTYISPSVFALRGFTAEEAIGQRIEEVLPPSSFQSAMQSLSNSLAQTDNPATRDMTMSAIVELEHTCKGGGVVPVELRVGLLRDASGTPVGLMGITRDISDRKRAQESLRQRAEELASLIALSRQVRASLSVNQVAQAAVKGVFDAVAADIVMLFLRQGEELPLQEVYPNVRVIQESDMHRAGVCLCGLAVSQTKPVFSTDIGSDPRCTMPECRQAGMRSFASLPLMVGSDVLGVLGLASASAADYARRGAFLEALAAEITIGLQNALLHQEVRRHAAELEQEIARRIHADQEARRRAENLMAVSKLAIQCAAASPDTDLFSLITDQLRSITGALAVAIATYDARARLLTLRHLSIASHILSGVNRLLGRNILGMPMTVRPEMYQSITAKVATVVDDLTEVSFGAIPRPIAAGIQKAFGVGAITGLALTYGGELQGTVSIIMPAGEAPVRLDLAETLAHVLAISLRRKKAEEALRESEERYRNIFEHSPIGIYQTTPDGRILAANPTLVRMLGYPSSEELARCNLERDGCYGSDHTRAEFKSRVEHQGEISGFEATWKREDGSTVYVRENAKVVRDERGQVLCYEGTAEDITERVHAEEETRRRGRELALLNRIIAASASTQDAETILDVACLELAHFFEVPHVSASLVDPHRGEASVVARYQRDGWPPDVNEAIPLAKDTVYQYLVTHEAPLVVPEAGYQEPATSATPCGHSDRFMGLLHQRRVAALLGVPLVVKGEVVGWLCLETDAARQFSASEIDLAWSVADEVAGALTRLRLDKDRRQLGIAIDQAAESVVIANAEGLILYVNPAFESLTCYDRAEVVGQKSVLFPFGVPDNDRYQEILSTIRAGRVWQGRIVGKRKDGASYTVDATITPIRDDGGTVINHVGLLRDVTHELQLEEQYRQAQKMEAVGLLAGGIAHDFNNLLTVINGFAELVQVGMEASDPGRDMVDQILQAGWRAADLVSHLLAFSRKQIIEPKVLDLNAIVVEMHKMLKRLIGEHIRIETLLEPDLWLVKADPAQMQQLIINLAVNGRDAMTDGGCLTIETTNVVLDEAYVADHLGARRGEHVRLTVSDTGVGMSEVVKAHIFEPFFTTKEVGKGTGLGLATVYGIVRQHGGHISIHSEEGRGTIFRIYMPHATDVGETLPGGTELAADVIRAQETILLVEDEAAVRELAVQALRIHGYRILSARDGQEALRQAQAHPGVIHLLLTDVVMPGMNGTILARRLVRLRPGLKILFMSGYVDGAAAHQEVMEPGVPFISKPFSPHELARKVREVLGA